MSCILFIHCPYVYSEYVKARVVAKRPHRSVEARRPSNQFDSTAHDDLEIPFGCVTLDKEIGSGAYGSIYHGLIACEHQTEPVEVAVKLLKSMIVITHVYLTHEISKTRSLHV